MEQRFFGLVECEEERCKVSVRVRVFGVDADGVSEERFCEGVVTEDSGDPAEVVENGGVAGVVFEEGCEQA